MSLADPSPQRSLSGKSFSRDLRASVVKFLRAKCTTETRRTRRNLIVPTDSGAGVSAIENVICDEHPFPNSLVLTFGRCRDLHCDYPISCPIWLSVSH